MQINAAAEVIYAAVDQNANIIFGALVDDSMAGEIAITVIATGFPTDLESGREKASITVGEAMRAAAALDDDIDIPKSKAPIKLKPKDEVKMKKQPQYEPEYEDEELEEEEEEEEALPPPPSKRRDVDRRSSSREPPRREEDVPDFLNRLRRKK